MSATCWSVNLPFEGIRPLSTNGIVAEVGAQVGLELFLRVINCTLIASWLSSLPVTVAPSFVTKRTTRCSEGLLRPGRSMPAEAVGRAAGADVGEIRTKARALIADAMAVEAAARLHQRLSARGVAGRHFRLRGLGDHGQSSQH